MSILSIRASQPKDTLQSVPSRRPRAMASDGLDFGKDARSPADQLMEAAKSLGRR